MTRLPLATAALALFAMPLPAQSPIPWAPPVDMADPAPTGQRISEAGLIANFFPAAGPGRHPAILVLGGSEGALGTGTTRIAKAFQVEGWTALHLSYYRAPSQPPTLENIPLETFDRALAWLAARADVDAKRIAIVGGSKGAEAALLVASRHPEIVAVVAGMPSSATWPGIDWAGKGPPGASWSLGGKPLPYLFYGKPDPALGMRGIYESGLATLPQHPEARIPIEKSPAPVLLICGEDDKLWPSCPMADQLAKADAHVRTLRYPQAGHAVFGPPLPEGDPRINGLAGLGGTPAGNQAARLDAWPKVLAFLKAALGTG